MKDVKITGITATQLTEHFNLSEFAVSASFPELVRPVPNEWLWKCEQLARVLEQFRPAVGPLRILSGYRTKALNMAVDGSPTSQHLVAAAVDVRPTVARRGAVQLFEELLFANWQDFSVGQIIWYPKQNFVHLALSSPRYPVATFCVHDPAKWKYHVIPRAAAGEKWLADKGY